MFRVEDNVPNYFVNYSRDFQLFSRCYDNAFSSTKFSIDSLLRTCDTKVCNEEILELIKTRFCLDVDFKDNNNLSRYVLASIPRIIRYKGTEKAIRYLFNIFCRLSKENSNIIINLDKDSYVLTLKFDKALDNLDIFYKVLSYIVPIGLIVKFEIQSNNILSTEIEVEMESKIAKIHNLDNSEINNAKKDIFDEQTAGNEFSPAVSLAEVAAVDKNQNEEANNNV